MEPETPDDAAPETPHHAPRPHDPKPIPLEVRGQTFTYCDEGPTDAPAIVLVHGIPGSVMDFRYLAPLLADRLRVLRLDLPGFGGSVDAQAEDWTPWGRAAAVADFASTLGIDRFAVLGHSIGGSVALSTASRFPDRVTALVLVASIGARRHRGMPFPSSFYHGVGFMTRVPGAGHYLMRFIRRQYRRNRFPRSEHLSAHEVRLHTRIAGSISFERLKELAAAVRCPALLAYADDDHLVEPAIGEHLAQVLPQAELVRYPKGGHNLQKTRAIDLAARIKRFLGL